MNKINLQEIVGGQLQAKFERSFEKVIENLQDPNTSFKVKRGITIKLDFTQNEDDYITLGRFNPAGDTMCIKKGKVIRSEYAETYCSPYYYIQMDDAREFMHNLAGFGHHQVLIFGDYTRLIKKIAKVMDFNILEG